MKDIKEEIQILKEDLSGFIKVSKPANEKTNLKCRIV
jgi:hypothetical protein